MEPETGAGRHGQRIGSHQQRQQRRGEKLGIAFLYAHSVDADKVNKQFGGDETHRAKHADGRIILDSVESVALKCIESH